MKDRQYYRDLIADLDVALADRTRSRFARKRLLEARAFAVGKIAVMEYFGEVISRN